MMDICRQCPDSAQAGKGNRTFTAIQNPWQQGGFGKRFFALGERGAIVARPALRRSSRWLFAPLNLKKEPTDATQWLSLSYRECQWCADLLHPGLQEGTHESIKQPELGS
jgi:hypothetical protein